MNGILPADDIARARVLGIPLQVSESADRVTDPLPADWPRPVVPVVRPAAIVAGATGLVCPTCDDGRLTIEYPRRCRECVKSGL